MHMHRRPRAVRGYTFIEVLIATSIMATLLAIGVPSLIRLKGPYALTGAAQRIAADLQMARQRAIAQNTRYRVTFTRSTNTYQIERETAPGVFSATTAPQPLPRGAALGTVAPSDPIFDTRGMLGAAVTVPVSVTGAGSRTVSINVLGHVTIS